MLIDQSSLNHPLRQALAAEVHSRPFLRMEAPESLTHLAIYPNRAANGGNNAAAQHATLHALCQHFGVTAPQVGANYFYHDFGRFRLKWECHAEFATFTFAQHHDEVLPLEEAFDRMPLTYLPKQWLLSLQETVIVAAHVVLEKPAAQQGDGTASIGALFEGSTLVASQTLQHSEVWTDFLIQSDGFSRFVLRDLGLREQQASRLVQRVLEIETYRMMALLGLPHAQRASPALNTIESELAMLTATMVGTDLHTIDSVSDHGNDEEAQLRELTALAARIEMLALDNSYRFSASQAYHRLVQARIDELRESRIEGMPTVGEFMERRLVPAMNTCMAVASRQQALAQRIAQSNDLLRTRVGIVQEQQNRAILSSMNQRAAQQLHLQQAVEGLSVVAISYYSVGLLSYLGKAIKEAGWLVNPDIAIGMLIPLVVLATWLGLRRLHRSASPKVE
ncbi:MAG: DUF3422 domain-containing protein [Pseudomonadota bacterium]|nr:DUF3422 domain-containing protein [Pseudomonadota bacterium]